MRAPVFLRVHTGEHKRSYDTAFVLQILFALFLIEKTLERTPSARRAYRREHLAQLSLKKNDQYEEPQADELIEDGSHQTQLEYLRYDDPDDEEGENPREKSLAARVLESGINGIDE